MEGIRLIEGKHSFAIFAPGSLLHPKHVFRVGIWMLWKASSVHRAEMFTSFCSLFLHEGTKNLQTPRLHGVNK